MFDGYSDKWSLKRQEHQQRAQLRSADISLTGSMNVTCGSKAFLRNSQNKKLLISLLNSHLRKSGYMIEECSEDVDVTIIIKAVEFAAEEQIMVTDDDTDNYPGIAYIPLDRGFTRSLLQYREEEEKEEKRRRRNY